MSSQPDADGNVRVSLPVVFDDAGHDEVSVRLTRSEVGEAIELEVLASVTVQFPNYREGEPPADAVNVTIAETEVLADDE